MGKYLANTLKIQSGAPTPGPASAHLLRRIAYQLIA